MPIPADSTPNTPQVDGDTTAISLSLAKARESKLFDAECLEQIAKRLREEANNIPIFDSWRLEPASDKQKALLRKYKANFDENTTKGEASDLLDELFRNNPKRG